MDQPIMKILTLEAGQNHDSNLLNFDRGWSVKIVPGASLFEYDKIKIWTNHPVKGKEFVRTNYTELPLNYGGEVKNNIVGHCMNWWASIKFNIPGSYHYYFGCNSAKTEILGSGYFQVRPKLSLPLDCIQCQTVLSKNLGTIDTWRDRLAVCYQSGYNMVHFTPVQELGGSNSAYSIADQLKFNPSFIPPKSSPKSLSEEVEKVVKFMNDEWKMLSITDIVLNHTANESSWLLDHPEAAYNCQNSPHLRPAYLFDRAIYALTYDMSNLRWLRTHGLADQVTSEEDLRLVKLLLTSFYLPQLRLYEMFMVNVNESVAQFKQALENQQTISTHSGTLVIQDKLYRRFKSTVDISVALHKTRDPEEFQKLIEQENQRIKQTIEIHIADGLDNVLSAITYERLQDNGPKLNLVSLSTPLVAPYFQCLKHHESRIVLSDEETMMYEQGQYMMAHNGWVMNYDPLKNFASEGSLVYLRRELIAWGDSIKLRYGDKPEDSPFLWDHMKKYVQQQAKIFHGLRLDNCHSTPIHVAQYLLDAARLVRPDLYIIAELFTSSEQTDNIFINKLGITSLVRESMSASNCRELGRLMYRFGGEAVGAFHHAPGTQPLRPSIAHAIFYDQTHDNESPMLKRTPYDCQATSSIVSMACCASGTNRGYDELVPHHISVVGEKRLYQSWTKDPKVASLGDGEVNFDTGMISLRYLINELHSRLYSEGFSEIFVDQVDEDVLAITRHNPHTCRSIILVARTAFNNVDDPNSVGHSIRSIFVPGVIKKVLFESILEGDPSNYTRNDKYINGLASFRSKILNEHIVPDQAKLVQIDLSEANQAEVKFDRFVPSSVLALESHPSLSQSDALVKINNWLNQHMNNTTVVPQVIKDLTMADINYILYRCDGEQEDDHVYDLPKYGKFPYCGFQGFMFILSRVHDQQDQAHPLCCNLREGNWLIDHTLDRLYKRASLEKFSSFIKEPLEAVKLLPRSIVPKYFDVVIMSVYNLIVDHKFPSELGLFVLTGPRFVKRLALSSVALIGQSTSAPLAPWKQEKAVVSDGNATNDPIALEFPTCVSIAAGLPHFSSGYMRNWGRDTFIAMRGLMLLTGRFDEARNIILSFAATLRHGLIPNLLDKGSHARYNCRDAVWWWLYCIKEYIELSPNGKGLALLEEQVRRLYPYDYSEPQLIGHGTGRVQPLCAIMQEAIERHFDGIDFIERNAGKTIDEHMTEPGFHVCVNVDRSTGFVFGGNQWNCGTWMDKMGSSENAKSKGRPASPRDGAAVEIVGLSYAVIKWLAKLASRTKYRYKGVTSKKNSDKWSWAEWATRIESNFEKHFWSDANAPDNHRPNVYKDLWACENERHAYLFRPNFLVAMVVAPELFTNDNARHCLEITREVLVGPLGMKTLDPNSAYYCGDYDNSDDSDNPMMAHGYNYHQGPEWLWLTGYYLRALLRFSAKEDKVKFQADVKHVKQLLANHYKHLEGDAWFGLPELTNSNGQFCKDSCPIQAWSISTILEAVYDLSRVKAVV